MLQPRVIVRIMRLYYNMLIEVSTQFNILRFEWKCEANETAPAWMMMLTFVCFQITVISKSLRPAIQFIGICRFYHYDRIMRFYMTQYPNEIASAVCQSPTHGLFL